MHHNYSLLFQHYVTVDLTRLNMHCKYFQVLVVAEQDFEDVRFTPEEWAKHKAGTWSNKFKKKTLSDRV